MPSILHLIVARGGSKGVPGKNLKQIGGLSLIGYKAAAARRSKHCTRLVLSSEDARLQDEARRHGVDVPFTRPAELATDTASSVDVVLHAMQWIETNSADRFDALMLLEPSAPFARASDLDGAVEMMMAKDANVVVGVRPVEVNSVFVGPLDAESRMAVVVEKMNALRSMRRQDVAQEYTMNAAFYLVKWDFLKRERRIYVDPQTTYGYPMPAEYSVEIDTAEDLAWAEFLVERNIVDVSQWRATQ
jgi:CMP-N,N'-diacetyllegionaminic acid synthase